MIQVTDTKIARRLNGYLCSPQITFHRRII